MMNNIYDEKLLEKVTSEGDDLQGAVSIRSDGEPAVMKSTKNITISKREDGKKGIQVSTLENIENDKFTMPVVITKSGVHEVVYNTVEVAKNSHITIYSGCAIKNGDSEDITHDGVHKFIVRENGYAKYIEKHYAEGSGTGKKSFSPKTFIELFDNATMEMEMSQIGGVDYTDRFTKIVLHDNSKLIITEKLLTGNSDFAKSTIKVDLNGFNSSAQLISKSVARDDSIQDFYLEIIGNNNCRGHIQCDSIISGNAKVTSTPKIEATDDNANLIHEAAIGRIQGDQLIKLMSFGMTSEEAEEKIIQGFLS